MSRPNLTWPALFGQGKPEESVTWFRQALQLKPNLPEVHQNLGMALLLLGDFEQGWREYEWRLQCKEGGFPVLPQPLWDGSPLNGKTILLHSEQGVGDTLQFIRYAPLVKERGAEFYSPVRAKWCGCCGDVPASIN